MKHILSILSYTIVGLLIILIILPSTVRTMVVSGKGADISVENNMDDEAIAQSSNQVKKDIDDMTQAKAKADTDALEAANTISATTISKPVTSQRLGEVSIDRVGIRMNLYFGDTTYILSIGAGMYEGSALPGYPGLTLIAAHNGKGQFGELGNAVVGDLVTITMPYGTYTYQVKESKVVNANDTTAYDFSVKDDKLILYTCSPMYYSSATDLRLFLYCDKVSGPVVK